MSKKKKSYNFLIVINNFNILLTNLIKPWKLETWQLGERFKFFQVYSTVNRTGELLGFIWTFWNFAVAQ